MQEYEESVRCAAEEVAITVMQTNDTTLVVTAEKCPFEGLIEVRYHLGQKDWECPVCETHHVDVLDED